MLQFCVLSAKPFPGVVREEVNIEIVFMPSMFLFTYSYLEVSLNVIQIESVVDAVNTYRQTDGTVITEGSRSCHRHN